MGPRKRTARRWGGGLVLVLALVASTLAAPAASATAVDPSRRPAAQGPTPPGPGSGDGGGAVVGGVPLVDDVRPAVAALLIPGGGSDPFSAQFCTGVLIAPRVVATTASCVTDQAGQVLPGSLGALALLDEADTTPPTTGSLHVIDGVSRHPGYDPITLADDLALVRLRTAVPAGRAAPLALADPASYPPGTLATVTGWGATNRNPTNIRDYPSRLHAAVVPVTTDAACDAAYTGPEIDDETTVCAGGTGRAGSCDFDGGAALTVTVAGRDRLVGLASFGPPEGCTVLGKPDAYVELAGFASFLEAHVEDTVTPVFSDVRFGYPFLAEVWAMREAGVVTGFGDGSYRPTALVTRQAMAAFLHRLAGAPRGPFPDPGFTDVGPDTPFADEIAWLASEGISRPDEQGAFRPGAPVSRGALAAFLHRLAGSPPGPFPDARFRDATPEHPFGTAIAWLAHQGITTGYPDGSFRPAEPVRRGPMAAFLHRAQAVLGS